MQASHDRLADLWVKHKPAVEAYVRARTDSGQVDDAVSQTFTIAWQRLDAVPADARPWLIGVARNVLLHQYRATTRHATLAVRATPLAEVAPGAEESALSRVALIRAWEQLPDADRDTLALVAWDGLTPAQAGKAVGVSRVAFSVRLLRARRRLEALIAAQDAVAEGSVTRTTVLDATPDLRTYTLQRVRS